jgi:hypothetical protein
MARIQILELPLVHQGDQTETPFVILIDKATENEAETLASHLRVDSEKAGARTMIVTTATLDLA